MLLEDQIVGDEKKSNESYSSLKISIIPTSFLPHVVHYDYGRAEKDNNDSLTKSIEQVPPEPLALPDEPKLRKPTKERRPSTIYPSHEHVILSEKINIDFSFISIKIFSLNMTSQLYMLRIKHNHHSKLPSQQHQC